MPHSRAIYIADCATFGADIRSSQHGPVILPTG